MKPRPPAPARLGPYLLERTLGRGGMGVVYLGRHEATGERVAVKSLTVARASNMAAIRREVQALTRIEHPGIVRIASAGLKDDPPWYAMALVDGQSLRARMTSEAWQTGSTVQEVPPTWADALTDATEPIVRDRPLNALPTSPSPHAPDLGPALDLARRLCAPLAYLHGEGIVHRDLKPENVLVRPDGSPVIIDFGLVAELPGEGSREVLEIAGHTAGTVAYMAPEQVRGERVDARADLYALGCLLYELVTGRPPFLAESTYQLLYMHCSATPAPPSRLVAGVPGSVDVLCLWLLGKEPRERPGHADAVACAIEDILRSGEGAAVGGSGAPGPVPRAYLYRARLAGRAAEMEVLEGALRDLLQGRGARIVIEGEGGSGKTRLALEACDAARRAGIAVHVAGCQGGAEPLGALRPLLQEVADRGHEQGGEALQDVASALKLLAAYEPALASLPPVRRQPEPAPLDPGSARERLAGALAELLDRLCGEGPMLLFLDDIHRADDLTHDLLRRAARPAVPLMLLATARAQGAAGDPSAATHVPVGRLPLASVSTMVADMLALEPAPRELVGFLHQQSEGNPMFVAEYLRTAVANGTLTRDRRGAWRLQQHLLGDLGPEDIPLPESLRELMAARLRGASPEAIEIAAACSVLGPVAEADVVHRMLGGEPDPAAIEELHRREVLHGAGERRYRFDHPRLRDVAYDALDVMVRGAWHRKAAHALEELPEAERAAALGSIAHHWEQAGDVARASERYLAAAARAAELLAYAEATRLYGSYLALAPLSRERVEARRDLCRKVLNLLGDCHRMVTEAEIGRQDAIALGARDLEATMLTVGAYASRWAGDRVAARSMYEAALAIATATGDAAGRGRLLLYLGGLHHDEGRVDEALSMYEESLAILRETGQRREEPNALANLGGLLADPGDFSAAARYLEEALAIHRELGNRRGLAMQLGNLATLFLDQGLVHRARELLQQSLQEARDVSWRWCEGWILGLLGDVDAALGRRSEAEARYREALGIQRDQKDRAGEARLLARLGQVLAEKGAREEARELLDAALEGLVATGHVREQVEVQDALAVLQMESGDVAGARARFSEALGNARRIQERRLQAIILLHLGRLERVTGGDAGACLGEAERLIAEVSDRAHEVVLWCERGHAAVAAGASGRAELDEARRRLDALALPPGSPVGREVELLRLRVERTD